MADDVLSDDEDLPGEVDSWLADAARTPAIAEPDLVGERLGRYRLDEVLGRGGMGIVYLAEDEQLRRRVALKVLSAERTRDSERRRRFVREARLTAKLVHPAIATVYDAGEVGERAFIAMEYVRGRTLRQALESGPLVYAEVVRIGRALAGGLAAAHASGIVHRDVKPDNVILGDDGTTKILDFGVAKARGTMDASTATLDTCEGRLVGTPAYMSPEQAKGGPIDARTDVFALGITLYEMTTGKRPFTGKTPVDVVVAIDRDEPTPVRSLIPTTPRALDRVIRRCLAKDPAARFDSAAEVLRALDELPLRARSILGPLGLAGSLLVPLAFVIARSGDHTASRAAPVTSAAPVLASTAPPTEPAYSITSSVRLEPMTELRRDAGSRVQKSEAPAAAPPARPRASAPVGPGPLDEPK
jgi:serine/threonine-protein kinase